MLNILFLTQSIHNVRVGVHPIRHGSLLIRVEDCVCVCVCVLVKELSRRLNYLPMTSAVSILNKLLNTR